MHAVFMRSVYREGVATSILQVRDVPEAVLVKLRARAAKQGVSLSAYVRELLTYDAERPSQAESIARIGERSPVALSVDDIVAAIEDGRR
jgi:antitoxin FitA